MDSFIASHGGHVDEKNNGEKVFWEFDFIVMQSVTFCSCFGTNLAVLSRERNQRIGKNYFKKIAKISDNIWLSFGWVPEEDPCVLNRHKTEGYASG